MGPRRDRKIRNPNRRSPIAKATNFMVATSAHALARGKRKLDTRRDHWRSLLLKGFAAHSKPTRKAAHRSTSSQFIRGFIGVN
jgi:hypothetical protein